MTEKRFTLTNRSLSEIGNDIVIADDGVPCTQRFVCNLLNELTEENEQLKTIRSDLISELDIVQNELNIAIDKGFAPSKSYKNYMASKKTEYDKFWENKIKHMITD